jgi:ABC-type Mn2+/Zn2+ transport system permease subunit
VAVAQHRVAFVVLLALVVGVAIKAVGVLLVSAFVVIPACAARVLSQQFIRYVGLSAVLGAVSAVLGMLTSAVFNLPSGPSIVMLQLIIFLGAIGVSQLRNIKFRPMVG